MSFVGKWFGFGQDAGFDDGIRAFEKGDFGIALEHFRASAEGAENRAVRERSRSYASGALGRLAAAAFSGRDFVAAKGFLEEAVELRPGFADLWLSLGRVRFVLGDSDGALDACDRALGINSRYAQTKLLQGIVRYKAGNRESGISRMKEAVDDDPRLLTSDWSEGLEAHFAGDFKRALECFKEIRPAASDVHSLVFEGDSLAKAGKWTEASEAYRLASELAPEYADLAVRRGQAFLELGNVEQAVVELRRATRLNPGYSEAFALEGIGLRRLGMEEEAMTAFRQALSIDPDQPIASQEVLYRRF